MEVSIWSLTVLILLFVPSVYGEDETAGNQKEDKSKSAYSLRWGPWTEWSVCGQSCGYGTQYRIRRCHKLRPDSVCQGATKQFKICNSGPCPPNHQGYRTVECAKHNHIYYGTRRYRWIPYINDQAPCELSCKSVGYGYFARFKTTVEDGVICNEDNTATCIQGECLLSGCDGILGSGSKEDICGVCGGNGDSCQIISGIFTRTHLAHRGYNIVATIPAGARGINVTEIARSKNHLALSTPAGYFLNGNLRLQALGAVKGGGTVFNYRRGWRHGCRGECLTADGPINSSVRVELIYFGRNPGIMYSYAIPNSYNEKDSDQTDSKDSEVQIKSRPTYIEDRLLPSDRQPLQGQQHRQDRLLKDAQTTRDPYRIIRNKQAQILTRRKPQIISRSGNKTQRKHPKKQRVRTIKMTPSRKVYTKPASNLKPYVNETGGLQYRHYYHTNALDGLGDVPVKANRRRSQPPQKNELKAKNEAWPNKPVSDSRKSVESKDKDKKVKGGSSSSSTVTDNTIPMPQPLRDPVSSNKTADNVTDNNAINEIDYRRSHRHRNRGVYSWRISGFTECTQPCGGGLQQTRVVCIKADSQVEVMEENCDVTAKPNTTTVVCNNQPCEARWSISKWSPCSVTCGRGLRKREVACQQRISPTLTIPVSAVTCPSPRPQARQYCQLDPCYKWKPSNWSKCSTVCGFGQRSRTLMCIDSQGKEVKQHLCTSVRPAVEEICDMGSCAQGWFHSKWTKECSAECGRGNYIRKVYCSAPDGSPLDENKCGGSEKKPRELKSCKAPLPCGGQWFAGPWSKCNDTCGSNAVRHREVLCIKQHGKRVRGVAKNHNCDESKKPPEAEPCLNMPGCLPQWYMMAWSECSKSCDTGIRTREVTCLDENLKPSPDCDKKKKPSTRQSCNTLPCKQNFAEFSGSNDGGKTQVLQQDGTIIEVPACEDKNGRKWCRLVSQARLCNYSHYRKLCCYSCQSKG